MSISYTKQNRGFTLIEMLVSLALFAIVVTTSVGTLLVLIDANAKAQSIQIAINNLSFALDSMTRQMRTGTDFYCGNNIATIQSSGNLRTGRRDCTSGGEGIAFTDSRTGERIGYAIQGPNPQGTEILRKVDVPSGSSGSWLSMTGDNIVVTELGFWVSGAADSLSDGDEFPPAITIYIEAEVGDVSGLGSTYQVQTTVTQRQYDL